MKKIDLDITATDQTQTVELCGFETIIRVYWVEVPAHMVEKLGVDVIEAGFPAASDDDFLAVKTIAETLKNTQVAALCRTAENDINRGWEAVKNAAHPRIHTFLATSDLHMEYKLKMTREQVIAQTIESVRQAASFTDNVEFSAEDGSFQ